MDPRARVLGRLVRVEQKEENNRKEIQINKASRRRLARRRIAIV